MSHKSIGIRKEWALKAFLENKGFLVMRSSASKTGIDLLAGNPLKKVDGKPELLALQVQTSEYIYPEKVEDLKKYAAAFGAQPLIALRRNGEWKFIKPEQLISSGKMLKAVL